MKRTNYVLQTRLDPASQDKLQWIQACLRHAIPELKAPSSATIIRRALTQYADYLGNIFCTGQINHRNVSIEGTKLAIAAQNNPVYWLDGVLPTDKLLDEHGRVIRWDLLEREARQEHYSREIDRALNSEGKNRE